MKSMTLIAVVGVAVGWGSTLAVAADDTSMQGTTRVSRMASAASQFVDDSAITATVKAKLLADEATHGREIKVQTRNGVVELSGEVASSREMRKAGALAHSVDGVQYIKNELKLKAP